MSEVWTPHLTVAAVIQAGDRFLLVEEVSDGRVVVNQPAGHLEENESLCQAVCREVREETGGTFEPRAITGIYSWRSPLNGITYIRVAFAGDFTGAAGPVRLDEGILRTLWLTRDELAAQGEKLRSPLVLRCVDDFVAGKRYPLELINQLG